MFRLTRLAIACFIERRADDTGCFVRAMISIRRALARPSRNVTNCPSITSNFSIGTRNGSAGGANVHAPTEDPCLAMRGVGREIWAGVKPDAYVDSLRVDWDATGRPATRKHRPAAPRER